MNPLFALLSATAAAVAPEPAAYPYEAELDLPAADLLRLDLTAAWVERCPAPGSYLLLDAAGRELPFAARDSDTRPAPRLERLRWEPLPTGEARGWRVEPPPGEVPARALRLADLPEGAVGVVEVAAWHTAATTRQVIWNLPGTGAGVRLDVPLDADQARGPWQVTLRWAEGWPWPRLGRDPGFCAVLAEPWGVEPATLELSVGAAVPAGETASDRLLRLPRAGLPLRGLDLTVADPLFSRPATLLGAEGPGDLAPLGRGLLERAAYGDLAVDHTRLELAADAPAELVLRVDDGRGKPLDLAGVSVEVRGLALIVPGVQAGPHRLLGCGPEAPSYDLENLEARLASVAPARAEASTPKPNPAWQASSAGAGLLAPGPALDVAGFGFERDVLGPPGLARVPLDEAVLSATRPGQPDLRFVDAKGRQLPYLLLEEATGRVLTGILAGREERGAESRLLLDLPVSDLPARALVLGSDRVHFRRGVRLLANPREGAVVLATGAWTGAEEGASRLVLDLDGRLPLDPVVAIHNGDNPPIEVGEVALVLPSVQAWVALPEAGGARLLYGHPTLGAPTYDVELLRARVLSEPAEVARLGAAQALAPPPRDHGRGLVLVAVGALALLLLGLIARLLRSTEVPS